MYYHALILFTTYIVWSFSVGSTMSRRRCALPTGCRFRQPKQLVGMPVLFARDRGGSVFSSEPSFATIGDQLTKK